MQTPMRPAWLALAWLFAWSLACIPPDPPEWVVSYPITWGISASVVESGPFASGLEVQPGHTRAELLPADTLELRWFGAAPEGAQIRPPIWMLTNGFFSPFQVNGGIPPCTQPLTSVYALCRLGEGERVHLTFSSDAWTDALYRESIQVLAIASDGDVIEPETCLQRTFSERNPDLAGCLIATRSVRFGPTWRMLQIVSPIDLDELPDEFFGVPPNANPVIEALHVERNSADGKTTQIVAPGDRIGVRPGERISVTLQLDADAAQDYVDLHKNSEDAYVVTPITEELIVAAHLNAVIDDYVRSKDGLRHSWTAPDGPEAVTFFVQVADLRYESSGGGGGGSAFATLRFVSTLEDGDTP